jgi:L-ribulokinase
VLREDESLRKSAYSWVEHCDCIPAFITGNTKPEKIYRSRCAAGHKAMWHEKWDGLPSEEFLITFEPLLKGFRKTFNEKTYTSNTKVGTLTTEWAQNLGLTTKVAVFVGAFDAEISSKTLLRAIGTLTCDIMVCTKQEIRDKLIADICGQVDESVIPGMIGLEAGQSGFGDIYAWFRCLLIWH